jgi:hypothetical protein
LPRGIEGIMGIGFTEFFLIIPLMFGGGGFGLPLGMPPAPEDPMMSKVAPEECIFYASWAGAAKVDPAANPTEKWLAQEPVQRFISKVRELIFEAIRKQGPSNDQLMLDAQQAAARMIDIMLVSPGAFYAERTPEIISNTFMFMPMEERQRNAFQGAVVVAPGERIEEFKKHLANIEKLLQSEGYIERVEIDGVQVNRVGNDTYWMGMVEWAHVGEHFIFGFGENSLQKAMANMKTPAPAWVDAIRKEAGIKRVASISMFDIQRYVDAHELAQNETFGEPLRELGLLNARSITWVAGLDDQGFICKTDLKLAGEPEGIFKFIDGEPLPKYILTRIPAENTFAYASRFSAKEAYEVIRKTIVSVGGEEVFNDSVQEFEETTGVQLKRDIVDALSGVIYLYGKVDIDNPFDGYVLSIGLENEMTFGPTIDKLTKLIREMGDMEITKSTVAGYDLYTVEANPMMFGMQPAWAIGDREFLLSFVPASIENHLKREQIEETSMAASTALHQVLSQTTTEPVVVTTLDIAELLKQLYPLFMDNVADSMIEEMQREDIEFTRDDIPTLQTLINGVSPCVSAVFRTNDGFQIVQRQTYPGGSAGATVGGLIATSTMASTVAMVSMKEFETENQLRQLVYATHNYHDANRFLPPAYSVSDDGKPLLSWRVHILPYIEHEDLYNQFHLDEPWDSEHNKTLIEKMPDVFAYPLGKEVKEGKTRFLGNATKNGAFKIPENAEDKKGYSLEEISNKDGTSKTISMLVVNPDNAVTWTKPDDLTELPEMDALEVVRGNHRGGFSAAFCDGSVRYLLLTMDADSFKNLLDWTDGKEVDITSFMREQDARFEKMERDFESDHRLDLDDKIDDATEDDDVIRSEKIKQSSFHQIQRSIYCLAILSV